MQLSIPLSEPGWWVSENGEQRPATPLESFAVAMACLGAIIEAVYSPPPQTYREIAGALNMTVAEVIETERLALLKLRAAATISPLRDWAPEDWDAESVRVELRTYWKERGR